MRKRLNSLDLRLLVPIILCIGGLLTGAVLSTIVSKQREISNSEYFNRVDNATEQLNNAVQKYSTLILAAQALFHASDDVSRRDFQSFINSLDIEKYFPFTQALSWNAAIESNNTASFERAVRLDDSIQPGGYPEFTVRPKTAENLRYIVTYLEPMTGNESAFGFDIGSNPARRATVEQARDTGDVVATAPITLAQESGNQKGFLMMLPVFNTDSSGRILQEKSELRGVVVAVFRIGDLIIKAGDLTFTFLQVFDVTEAWQNKAPELIFSRGDDTKSDKHEPLVRSITLANRQWKLVFTKPPEESATKTSTWAVGILGGLFTVLFAVFVGFIVTSRRRVERLADVLTVDLRTANKELNRSNEDLTQFAFVASHDLQTPIRNVRMSVDLLEEELGEVTSPEVKEYLKILNNSAERMMILTSDLLSYAKLGHNELQKTEINLNSLFRNVKRDTHEMCKADNVSLIVNDLPTIRANEQQLERVFTNLLENATRYAHPERSPVVEVDYTQTDDVLNILIKDNGIGIDSKFHDTIFIPFRRLHSQDKINGTGLGLSICKKIIENHGGSISVASSSANGTVFSISLPNTIY
ncbi:MAG: CHASE domain-containing protein [Granulosicoccus sp.]